MCAGQEGDDDAAMMNGDIVSTASNDAGQIRRQDIVTVTGKQDDCDAACAALRVCTNNSLTSSPLFSNVASCRHLYKLELSYRLARSNAMELFTRFYCHIKFVISFFTMGQTIIQAL